MTTKTDITLLPCPFCGCAMTLSTVARDWWRISGNHDDDCILCDQRHDVPQTDDQKQLLIDAWNRRAAVQADRKRGGEPVGIVKRPSESHYPGVQWLGDVRDGEHLYTAPQSAKPVKVPSDIGEVIKRLQEADKPLIQQGKFSDVRELLREATALLARYGAAQPATQPNVDPDFVADLARSRAKYLGNARMFDGLMGEVDELHRAYAGDGDIRAEAFDVAVCAYRIATEGDTGGNTLLSQPAASAELTDLGPIRIGNLPTMNQDEYPDLGDWWVQLRIGNDGDEVLARVYGDTPEQARSRAVALAAPVAQDREDVADMFWDADDTEDCLYAYDEETAVERMVEKAWPTDFPLHFTLQRAVRLPILNIKVTSMSDCGTDIQYEREAIDHARRFEGDGE